MLEQSRRGGRVLAPREARRPGLESGTPQVPRPTRPTKNLSLFVHPSIVLIKLIGSLCGANITREKRGRRKFCYTHDEGSKEAGVRLSPKGWKGGDPSRPRRRREGCPLILQVGPQPAQSPAFHQQDKGPQLSPQTVWSGRDGRRREGSSRSCSVGIIRGGRARAKERRYQEEGGRRKGASSPHRSFFRKEEGGTNLERGRRDGGRD